MELNEISLAQLLNNTSGTEYFTMFAKLIGHSEDSIFYEGINDSYFELLDDLEYKLGRSLPSNYLEFLSYLNGGHFFNIDLFSLADKDYSNSLYCRNFLSNVRKELNLNESILIIGKCESYILYVNCEDADGSYTLMDIRKNEKIQFENFGSLIGFIFYILVMKHMEQNKEIEKEKLIINEMKEKLHEEVTKRSEFLKKESQKKNDKLREKIAKKGLKEKMRKAKR